LRTESIEGVIFTHPRTAGIEEAVFTVILLSAPQVSGEWDFSSSLLPGFI
jgi:hypothetical protein